MLSVPKLVLVVLVFGAFSPCLNAQYLRWDDYKHFISNPCVYSLSWYNLTNLFHQTVNATYIPLTTLSFNLEYHLFGLSPLMSHLINILLHLGIVLMVYDLARSFKLSSLQSFIAAAIFAVHPMHVESVAWVTERKDVLSILFYIACLKQYWLYLESKKSRRYWFSLGLGVLSILSKPMAVSIPWVLLLLDWFYQRKWDKMVLLDKLPFALLIFPVASITVFQLSPHPQIVSKSLLIGVWSFAWYLERFIFPVNLIPAYSPALPLTLTNFSYALSVIVFIFFISAMFLCRRNRLFIFACLFWMATIFIFWRFDFADNNIVADRFMYLPSLGFCLWIGVYLSRFKLIAGLVIVLFGLMTFNQCGVWKNTLALWTWTVTHDPRNAIARGNLDEAMYAPSKMFNYQQLTDFIDQNPLNSQGYFNRGVAIQEDGNLDLAFADFNRAIKLDPKNYMAYDMRGQLYALRGDERAFDDYNRAIKLKGDYALAYLQEGLAFEEKHRALKAMDLFNQAIKINPSMGAGFYQRGLLYTGLGEYGKAIDDLTRSITLNNDLKNSYYQRAEIYELLKEYRQSELDFKGALKQDPSDVHVLNELGILYMKQGNDARALDVFNKTISMHPFSEDAYINRGIVEIQRHQFDLALGDYTKAIKFELYPYHALITRADIYVMMGERDKALKDYDLAMLFSQGDHFAQIRRDQLMRL